MLVEEGLDRKSLSEQLQTTRGSSKDEKTIRIPGKLSDLFCFDFVVFRLVLNAR